MLLFMDVYIGSCFMMPGEWFLRPRLHGTGRIWNRAEIRPFRLSVYTKTTEPDEFETP
jgi:hypothetical protein